MAGVDGSWNTVVKSPLGDQTSVLTVNSDGNRWAGSQSGSMGSMEITDGTLDGDTLRWTMQISVPMPMKLECEATVEGDVLRGTVSAGAYGSFPMTGERA